MPHRVNQAVESLGIHGCQMRAERHQLEVRWIARYFEPSFQLEGGTGLDRDRVPSEPDGVVDVVTPGNVFARMHKVLWKTVLDCTVGIQWNEVGTPVRGEELDRVLTLTVRRGGSWLRRTIGRA